MMSLGSRVSKIHAEFLESSRSLEADRRYWKGSGGVTRWLARLLVPSPLLGLHPEGKAILEALVWLEDHCRSESLGEATLRRYHSMLGLANAEGYRRGDLTMPPDNPLKPAPAHRIAPLMAQLGAKLTEQQAAFDRMVEPDRDAVLLGAVSVYHRIGSIHPFSDGNGRVARLAMNHLLRRYGLPYVVLPSLTESPRFWEILKSVDAARLDPLVQFARECSRPV